MKVYLPSDGINMNMFHGEKQCLINIAMKAHIQEVLDMAGGKVQGEREAAALLGINPSTLRNRMKRFEV